ncbi:MAG: DUF721 domain-containing protein [Deltaproteobacteria bacterium]|nr:DUF721 domain-containing protein [Deltaproteobacteria bacterium]
MMATVNGCSVDDPARARRREGGVPRNLPAVAVGELLEKVLDNPKVRERLLHDRVFSQWRRIVGPGLLDKCRPVRIKRHILYIEVKNSSWAHQLIYMQEEIINRVNRLVGVVLITGIHCRAVKGGKLASLSERGEKNRGRPDFSSLVSEAEEEEWRSQICARVSDRDLAELLLRMRCSCEGRRRFLEKN